jgi:hypothetical protein
LGAADANTYWALTSAPPISARLLVIDLDVQQRAQQKGLCEIAEPNAQNSSA